MANLGAIKHGIVERRGSRIFGIRATSVL